MGQDKRAVLIAGPTASGKSALALKLAQERGALIVNADAMQVYGGLSVLTARPTAEDLGKAEHRLYGTVPPSRRFSTGEWARAVADILAEGSGRPLIFVGGTGLYFEVLTQGFADVPPVPPSIVAEIEASLVGLDARGRAAVLQARDPEMAARLQAPDPQRVTRALAVRAATGRSLATFQDEPQAPLLEGFALDRIVLSVDRNVLNRRIAARFSTMVVSGAMAEVEGLLALGLDPSLPVMKAIGVPELSDVLAGRIGLAEAVERGSIATRQYAKRQRTWFRNRMADWAWVDPLASA